ncbi:MAG: extracellular solute-binding protein [Anaerolineae bacterium]|nr:extracellular solute-binding protein [Anaerolineae bacterium]
MFQPRFLVTIVIAVLTAIVACSPQLSGSPTAVADATDVPPVTPTAPTATLTPTARPNLTLRFWLPDSLAGLDSVDAGDVLSEQISEFEQAFPNIQVELRLRAANGTGGILETIRAAAQVAPGALPDVTLMRLQDFRAAVQEGLLQPLSESDLVVGDDDFMPAVAALGQIDGQWLGVPSTLEVLHVAYQPTDEPVAGWRFDQVLTAHTPLLFPGMSSNGLSPVFLLQYLVAVGEGTDPATLPVDETALRATLRFYERAASDELVTPTVLEYDAPERYPDALDGDIPAVVSSSLYLQFVSEGQPLDLGYIPTTTGEPATTLDGWLWVVVRSGNDQQSAALRFINWMMSTERQVAYHQAIHMLPATRAAQRQLDPDYATFVETLLQKAIPLLPEITNNLTARAFQTAFAAVINGQSTAADALSAALSQVGG